MYPFQCKQYYNIQWRVLSFIPRVEKKNLNTARCLKMTTTQVLLNLLLLLSISKLSRCIDENNNEIVPSDFPSQPNMNHENLQPVKISNDDPGPPYIDLPPSKPVVPPISLEQSLLRELTKKIGDSSKLSPNSSRRRNNSDVDYQDSLSLGHLQSLKPILFTIGSSDTGLRWNQIPYREKFQWHIKEAPCHPFKIRIPDEHQNRSVLDVCIFRDHLDFHEESIIIVHSQDTDKDDEKEMKILGQVHGVQDSTVSGKIVDTFFYGEISVQDPFTRQTTIYVVEEIKFLSELIRNNEKVMRILLSVMNSGLNFNGLPIKYNAVITQGVSIVNFITDENSEVMTSKPLLILSTGHNSYITPGDTTMMVEDSGRITFSSPGNEVSIDVDGSVQFKTDNKEYTFRPNGRTIIKEGMNVLTLQEHEGSVALMAFTSSSSIYSCMLPTPAFNLQKQGGYLCKVCLATDAVFEKYFTLHHQNTEMSSSRYLGYIIDQVSWMFRATDWNNDGVSDNVGLDWDVQFFEWSYSSDVTEEDITDDELEVLFKSLTETDFSECCLGIAYTMKKFPDSTFAKSSASKATPTGGVCSNREQAVSNNIILISANDKTGHFNELAEDKLIYVTAHEIAKAFGASADVTGQLECDQFKQHDGTVGHFILWPDVMRNISAAEKKFSPCSKKSITEALSSCKSSCFDVNRHPFCGNGIVEDSEECDCGDEYSCSKQKCCHSRNDKYPCRKTGKKCKKSSAIRLSFKIGILFIITHFLFAFY